MRVLLIVGASLLGALQAFAQPSKAVIVRGAGTSSCADFAKVYQQNPKATEDVFVSWAFGFWSGLNTQLLNEHKPMRDVSGSYQSMSIVLRRECDRRPLVPFATVANDYFKAAPQVQNSLAK